MEKTINIHLAQMEKLGANSGHMQLNNIRHTKDLTAVVSVYKGIKPSHMVITELYDWASEHNQEVKNLIETIASDMSWNEDNPV